MLISRQRRFGLRHFTLSVMLLVLSLRALVPIGFMPDAGALRDGRLEMTFCTSTGGAQTIAIDLHGTPGSDTAPSSDHHQTTQSSDCPFNVLTSMPALPTLALAVLGLPVLLSQLQAALHVPLLFSTSVQGPPLGSRAPPYTLD